MARDDPLATGRGLPSHGGKSSFALRVLRAAQIDLRPGSPPSNVRLSIATLASLVLSLVLCALAVHVAASASPGTRHFSHFRAADYGSLTVVGVLTASGAWAVLVRVSSAAHRNFLRLVVVSMLVLWIPDAVLFALGEAATGVVTLMVMHLLVAVVTYNLLVRVAPQRAATLGTGAEPVAPRYLPDSLVRRVWSAIGVVVVLELVLGVAVIVSVPYRRSAAILPSHGTWVYAAHGAVGVALCAGAVAVLFLSALSRRIGRVGAVMGAIGVAVGAAGGVFATFQQTRLLGMGVMLVGVVVAGVGYLAPSLEALAKAEAAKAEAARAALAVTSAARAGGPDARRGGDAPVSANGHDAFPPSG